MGAITESFRWQFCFDHVTHLSIDENSTAFVQGDVASPPSPISSVRIRAVVAVQSIRLATSVPLEPGQGRQGSGGLRLRVQRRACAERQENGWPQT